MYSDLDRGGMVRGSKILHEIREVYLDCRIRTRRWSMASGWFPSEPPEGNPLYHACQPLEHLTGHSTTVDELFPTSKPNVLRIYVKLGRASR